MLTASGEESHIKEAFDAGADDYMMKPPSRQLLKAKLESTLQAIEERAQAEEGRQALEAHSQLMTELEEARQVQATQIPSLPISWEGWFASGTVVSSRQVGGDM